ncbi:hypothetical protein D3C73_613980 [compost metagenome]
MLAEHVVDRAHGHAGGLEVNEQLRQTCAAIALLLRPGAQQRDHVVGQMSARGPDLAAVDDPAAIGFFRTGAHSRQIGTDVGLTHADRQKRFTAGDARDDLRGQYFRRKLDQQRTALAFTDPVRAHRRASR